MTTHRSLNKLEFKAHMSIHNMKEVEEGEAHDLNATRDRFGKKHQLSNEDGASRIVRRKPKKLASALLALAAPLFWASASAEEAVVPPDDASLTRPTARRNTDVRYETEGMDANSWLNQKYNEPAEKFGIPIDDNYSLGINEDGDPNVGMSF